jgi:hypothetical protein
MAQTPMAHTPNMTDYEAERRSFHLEVPEYFNFATDVIGKWAADPHKLAMFWVGSMAKSGRSPLPTSLNIPAGLPTPLPAWVSRRAIACW